MARSKKTEKKVENKAKILLKRHDPTKKVEKTKHTDKEKQHINALSRSRRAASAAINTILREKGQLTDKDGNIYTLTHKRIVKNGKQVVRKARDGTLHFIDFQDAEELKDPKFDAPIVSDIEEKVYETLEKIFDGDEELHHKMKKSKVVVPVELSDEDCFWKNLSEEEKKKILKKIKPKKYKF